MYLIYTILYCYTTQPTPLIMLPLQRVPIVFMFRTGIVDWPCYFEVNILIYCYVMFSCSFILSYPRIVKFIKYHSTTTKLPPSTTSPTLTATPTTTATPTHLFDAFLIRLPWWVFPHDPHCLRVTLSIKCQWDSFQSALRITVGSKLVAVIILCPYVMFRKGYHKTLHILVLYL